MFYTGRYEMLWVLHLYMYTLEQLYAHTHIERALLRMCDKTNSLCTYNAISHRCSVLLRHIEAIDLNMYLCSKERCSHSLAPT